MKVFHNVLDRTESARKIQDLFVSSFYEAIGLKLRIFSIWVANSLGGVIYGDLFLGPYVNESFADRKSVV